MRIAAYNRCSLVDYEGRMAAVVFTRGCNMSCPYCHNRDLEGMEDSVSEEEVLGHLALRKGLLEGVVVSGGEPTLQEGLVPFLERVKALGYPVKLDTNGTRPDVLEGLLEKGLVDHVAMDIKTVPEGYGEVSGWPYGGAVEASVALVRKAPSYEFRTTAYPEMGVEALKTLCRSFRGEPYYLQQYRPVEAEGPTPFGEDLLRRLSREGGARLRGVEVG
ncbi:anaerobic ribonucleoside-triphosphate reductase activating protein [Anaerotalea alkaliphila]|uniref:Anaerobic ribonucleoside-triphosphate reductase activating protein n=1 Tax=Anaerotalea alkaliphila TaxID=2662126 RepID=A0A7X5HTJ7_9FIRM|nr:anaerobic ribonucleoside-triphosphate reductase activating protein [Anaerotalea alkaliphila]NDL66388.1 anaerobic ribonucleoside-triphosphate reductase activating protein [Anaerotalea alkaliphila]